MTAGRGTLLLLVGLAAGSACHHAKHADQPSPDTAPVDVPLEVDNHNWLDVVIYVVHDGERSRVGIVNASSQSSFVLPARLVGQGHELRLLGHPIGGEGGTLTETVTVQPGQYIQWTLESDLSRSAIGVY
ncbi:MAG TPA: hypothetical protein VFP28_11835 [Gemmatimonadales bacterium]|nr:hypothetical protein [Gemmatimonadales bacterium]